MILALEKVHLSIRPMARLNYLLLSPVNRYGGVNLDVGFMAHIISEQHQVRVISLGRYYDDTTVFYFDNNLSYTSVDRELYRSSRLLRLCSQVTSVLKPMSVPNHHRLDNSLSRKLAHLDAARKKLIETAISSCDRLVLCAQLTAPFMQHAIEVAASYDIPILFRTTGQILDTQLSPSNAVWLSKVGCFIHHSQKNKDKVAQYLPQADHHLIDQNAYDQERFLQLPALDQKITRFYSIGRLSPLKRNLQIIKAFLAVDDTALSLHIYGDGEQEGKLKAAAAGSSNIHFHGPVAFDKIHQAHGANDCLIIASRIEAGPYTGIEAMASGRMLISARVGAMESRLPDYPYFYEGTHESLAKQIKHLSTLSQKEVVFWSNQLRQRYTEAYSEETIRARYREVLLDPET